MQAKEIVLDRIEQSFGLLKNNFKAFFLPMSLYNFIASIFTITGTYFAINTLQDILNTVNVRGMDYYDILYNPTAQIIILSVVLLLLTYFILYIPFLLGLIKSISQAYNGEKPDCKKNLKYGFSNLGNSFKTYWYIFAYVTLIPALLFIVGGIVILYGKQYNLEMFTQIGGVIISISILLFIYFAIYRGTKAAFGLQSAVDNNNYSLVNFKQSVKNTKNKFWRVLGNFMLVGIIGGLVVGMIMGVVDNFGSSYGMGANTFFDKILSDELDPKIDFQAHELDPKIDFQAIINELISSYSPIANIITNIIQGIIKTTFSIFLIVFTYIFFKRLEIENNEADSHKTVEL